MFSLFSKYRAELMGISIIMLMIFHASNPSIYPFGYEVKPLKRADIGVDFFLILSAVGCYFSLSKNADILRFYKKRIIRIIPTFVVCVFLFSLVQYYTKGIPLTSFWEYVTMLALLKGDVAFWYIGNIMVCYFAMPFLYKLSKYKLVYYIFSASFTLIVFFLAYKQIGLDPVSLCKFPIFVISILVGKSIYENNTRNYITPRQTFFALTIVALICYIFTTIVVRGTLGKYISLIIVSIPLLLWLSVCVSFTPIFIRRFFSFIGGISLEIYLLHSLIVSPILYIFIQSTVVLFICTFIVTISLGYLIHITINRIINVISEYENKAKHTNT